MSFHPSGPFSGAARSLLRLLRGLPPGSVTPRLIMPRGQAADLFERAGYSVATVPGMTQFDCTRYGYYRGLRWVIVLRELLYLPFTVLALLRARRNSQSIDLIHANEVTAIVAALIAKFLLGKPLVVHVRSVQQREGIALRRRLLVRFLKQHADAVIAIDATVRDSLPSDVEVSVVHNGFAPEFAEPPPAAVAEMRQRFHDRSLRVGMVGSLLPLKGVHEFLEAARISVRNGMNADFVIVGSNVRPLSGARRVLLEFFGLARDVERDMHRFIARHGLQDRVHLLGFQPEISAVYRSLDFAVFSVASCSDRQAGARRSMVQCAEPRRGRAAAAGHFCRWRNGPVHSGA